MTLCISWTFLVAMTHDEPTTLKGERWNGSHKVKVALYHMSLDELKDSIAISFFMQALATLSKNVLPGFIRIMVTSEISADFALASPATV